MSVLRVRKMDSAAECLQNASLAGGVAEWLNALVLKTSRAARLSWVRILPPPPISARPADPDDFACYEGPDPLQARACLNAGAAASELQR